jgi:integrase
MRGQGRTYPRNGVYWIDYSLNGERYRESAHTESKAQAEKLLEQRLDERGAARVSGQPFTTPAMRRLKVRDLLDNLRADLAQRGKDSPQNLSTIKQAGEAFGDMIAMQLKRKPFDKYIEEKRAAGYRDASINRVTGAVQQALKLAVRDKVLAQLPCYIPHLSEAGNARQGFCDAATFDKVCAFLPSPELQDFARFAFSTGWRRKEIAQLEWSNVQDSESAIRLKADQSKNRHARLVPITGPLVEIIEHRRRARQIDVNGTTQLCSLVFHREGRAIMEFRKAWASACRKAGVPSLLFHDLRRSAVTSMIHAHVPQLVAMQISGHRTVSMFQRYGIQSADEMRDAMAATEAYRENQRKQAPANVKSIAR